MQAGSYSAIMAAVQVAVSVGVSGGCAARPLCPNLWSGLSIGATASDKANEYDVLGGQTIDHVAACR
jgi:hypothetical protein